MTDPLKETPWCELDRDNWLNKIERTSKDVAVRNRVMELEADNERLRAVLDYVYERTCIQANGEWTFKVPYDPQIVIDARNEG